MILIFTALYFLVFLTGISAFIHTFRLKKKGFDYASPYAGFILVWNLLILERYVFGFFKVDLFDLSRFEKWPTVLISGDGVFRTLATLGALFLFVHVLSVLSGKREPQKFRRFFSAVLILLSFVLGIGTAFAIIKSNFDWITHTQHYSVNACLFLLLFFTIVYHLKNKSLPNTADRNRALNFGKFYITAFFVLSAIFILSLWNLFSHFLIVLLYLLMNIFPSAWHRVSVLDAELESRYTLYKKAMERLKQDHKLTPREEEIAWLLLEGHGSQEIQEMLFISIGTVKNHIYNLYKKLGIRSQEELSGLFSNNSEA